MRVPSAVLIWSWGWVFISYFKSNKILLFTVSFIKYGLASILCHFTVIGLKIENVDRPLIYNFTSSEDSEYYWRWWPLCAKPFICLFLSSFLSSLFLSVSLYHSAHSNPQWREAPGETAWRWQRTWEPFKASYSESDKGLCDWQLGTPLEPCTALRCTVLAVDPVLKPPPNPAPLETTYRNTDTHIIYISLIVSLLQSSMYIDGWWWQKIKENEQQDQVWERTMWYETVDFGGGDYCRNFLQHHQCGCLRTLIPCTLICKD